jgi:hypothetical protein
MSLRPFRLDAIDSLTAAARMQWIAGTLRLFDLIANQSLPDVREGKA